VPLTMQWAMRQMDTRPPVFFGGGPTLAVCVAGMKCAVYSCSERMTDDNGRTYLPENEYQHYRLRQRPHNKALIPKTTYLFCYFRDVYPFIFFIIAIYVHHLRLYCVLFRRFLISKLMSLCS